MARLSYKEHKLNVETLLRAKTVSSLAMEETLLQIQMVRRNKILQT